MPIRKQLMVMALSLLSIRANAALPIAQTTAATQAEITASQLKAILTETRFIKVEKAETQRMLNARFAELPAWFPATLKSFINGKVASANPVKVDLPIYRKYITSQQADQLILFFQGPAGEAVAAHLSPQTPQPEFAALVTARLSQLTQLDPQQQAAIRETVIAYQAAQPRIRDDQGIAFDTAFNKARQEVISQHMAEYSAAALGNNDARGSLSTR